MKTDFSQLIKDLRLALRSEFKNIVANVSSMSAEEMDRQLADLEQKQNKMIVDAGYNVEEYNASVKEYFMDFSSSNPDEWVVRHDPENAQIIGSN